MLVIIFLETEVLSKDYELRKNMMVMENSSSTKIVGKGPIQVKCTTRKIGTVKDVLHVPNSHKNLLSSLLSKHDF